MCPGGQQDTAGSLAGEQAVVTDVTPSDLRGAELLRELDHLSIAPGAKGNQDEITAASEHFSCFRL